MQWSVKLGLPIMLVATGTPLTGQSRGVNVDASVEAAARGGVVLLCRHAITGRMQEREPVDYGDSTTQRLLSREGERQSARMGRALRALDIPVASVVASPMHRARRTAEIMFGETVVIDSIWHTNGSEYTSPAVEQRIRVLQTPIERGNLLIVSHIGTMGNALGESPGEVGEGDCVVVRPGGDSFDVVGVVPWRVWIRRAPA